jgi:hypothetical protein
MDKFTSSPENTAICMAAETSLLPLAPAVNEATSEMPDDIDDVMREERARGKRRVDMEARRERARVVKSMREHLSLPTEEEFLKAMRAVGLEDGSPALEQALQAWREFES